MTENRRSPLATVFLVLLLLSGWAVAVGLYWRQQQPNKSGGAYPPREVTEYARLFLDFESHPSLQGTLIGFCLLDENGEPVYASPLAETALCPASALKTVTTGAALAVLGPEFRFDTTLAGTAAVGADGVLNGDLILVGGGDPTLSQEDLDELAKAAVGAGLKKVNGRLLVDATVFPVDPVSEHWNWGDIGNAYGAGAFGVNLDHNRLSIRFQPGRVGEPAALLGLAPASKDTVGKNFVVTGPANSGDQVVVYSEPYGREITLRGSVPVGNAFSVSGAIPDPPALALEGLQARLEAAGVTFGQQKDLPAGERVTLASHQSEPLPEILDHLHEVSDNLEAQCLFLMLGKKLGGAPAAAIRQYWEKAGVKFTALRLIDGSGLARANMIRPLDLARVNLAARKGPHGDRYLQSLSAHSNEAIRGKIGGMSGVKTEVGFIQKEDGRELTFCLMGNGLPVDREFWGRLNQLLEAVRKVERD